MFGIGWLGGQLPARIFGEKIGGVYHAPYFAFPPCNLLLGQNYRLHSRNNKTGFYLIFIKTTAIISMNTKYACSSSLGPTITVIHM